MSKKSKIAALIVAGGRGKRLGGDIPKQYMNVNGEAVIRHSIRSFLSHKNIDTVLVVIHPDDIELYEEATLGLKLMKPVFGGSTRQESVLSGLKNLSDYDLVLIHDAARPFVTDDIITKVIVGLDEASGVIPAIPVSNTIKSVDSSEVINTLDRENLVYVQTPQGFRYKDILDAHLRAKRNDYPDDAALLEEAGMVVKTVSGDKANFKITKIDDLPQTTEVHVGFGFDVHRFCDGDHVMICGVLVPHTHSLEGHSDADVGIHAIVDAILGSIAEGDIGEHFSPDDPKWKNTESSAFLKYTHDMLTEKGGKIIHIDVTIICESPKISSYKKQMRERIAEILKIDIKRISVKATTTEQLGFTGRKEGVAANSVVTVQIVK